jgi:hypothetical protein
MQKLRILCLHGYHGSADVLRDQMARLTDGMDALEFVLADPASTLLPRPTATDASMLFVGSVALHAPAVLLIYRQIVAGQ